MMSLSVSTHRRDNAALVTVVGDIDLATRDQLDAALAEAIALAGMTAVDVDLAGVEFLDSSGIAVLLKNRRRAESGGKRFSVVAAGDLARRILVTGGVWELLSEGRK